MTSAVNHLAPFLLTTLLLDRMKESQHARVITTASHGHKMAKKGINFDDLTAETFIAFPKILLVVLHFVTLRPSSPISSSPLN